MASIQELREKRTVIANTMRDLLDKNPGAKWKETPDNQRKYDAALVELDDIEGEITRINAVHERIKDDAMSDSIKAAGDKAIRDARPGSAHSMYARFLRGGEAAFSNSEWADIRAAMSTTTGSEGGFSVQTDVAKSVIDQMKAYGGMRSVATVLSMASGNAMSFPTSDGTAEIGEQIGENATATAQDVTFGTIALNVFKYSSKTVAVPIELLQDSQIDVEAFVNKRLGTRLGRITNQKYTIGTGTAEPRGVVVGAGLGKTGLAGQTLSVIFDDLVDLVHAPDPAYRAAGSGKFMMHDLSFRNIRKLKDSTGRPIYIPGDMGLSGRIAESLHGYEVVINQDVAVMAANAKSILFGDFSNYYIRDVMQVSMFRFTDSAYIKLGQIGFMALMRSGGNLLDASAVKYYANSAT